jgi:hypothetical protein
MKSIRIDCIRSGEDEGVLTKGVEYHMVVDSERHRSYRMRLGEAEFRDQLAELCYDQATTEEDRRVALTKLSKAVTEVLDLRDLTSETDGVSHFARRMTYRFLQRRSLTPACLAMERSTTLRW